MSDPMTAEEIAAAREWVGLDDEQMSDAEIVDGVKDSLWLVRFRIKTAWAEFLSKALKDAQEELEGLRIEMTMKK